MLSYNSSLTVCHTLLHSVWNHCLQQFLCFLIVALYDFCTWLFLCYLNSFFGDLNDRIFQTLIEVSQSQDRQLTSEHMKVMGLDPVGDRVFLMELVEIYGIDVMLIVDNPCCPTWCISLFYYVCVLCVKHNECQCPMSVLSICCNWRTISGWSG